MFKKYQYLLVVLGFSVCLLGAIWTKEPVKCFLSAILIVFVGRVVGVFNFDSTQYIDRTDNTLDFTKRLRLK